MLQIQTVINHAFSVFVMDMMITHDCIYVIPIIVSLFDRYLMIGLASLEHILIMS